MMVWSPFATKARSFGWFRRKAPTARSSIGNYLLWKRSPSTLHAKKRSKLSWKWVPIGCCLSKNHLGFEKSFQTMCFRRGSWIDGKAQMTNRFLQKVDWLSLVSRIPWSYNLNEALQHLRMKASLLVCRRWPVTNGTLLQQTYVRLLVKLTKRLVNRRLQRHYHQVCSRQALKSILGSF